MAWLLKCHPGYVSSSASLVKACLVESFRYHKSHTNLVSLRNRGLYYCFAMFWLIRSGLPGLRYGNTGFMSFASNHINRSLKTPAQRYAAYKACRSVLLERLSWILLVLRFANLQGSPRSRRSADSTSLDRLVPVRFWRSKELQVDNGDPLPPKKSTLAHQASTQ